MRTKSQLEFDKDYNFVERAILHCDNENKHVNALHKLVELFEKRWSGKYLYAHLLLSSKIIYNNWTMNKMSSMERKVIVEKTNYFQFKKTTSTYGRK